MLLLLIKVILSLYFTIFSIIRWVCPVINSYELIFNSQNG